MRKITIDEEMEFLKERVRNLEGFMSFVEHIFDYHDLDYRSKERPYDAKTRMDN